MASTNLFVIQTKSIVCRLLLILFTFLFFSFVFKCQFKFAIAAFCGRFIPWNKTQYFDPNTNKMDFSPLQIFFSRLISNFLMLFSHVFRKNKRQVSMQSKQPNILIHRARHTVLLPTAHFRMEKNPKKRKKIIFFFRLIAFNSSQKPKSKHYLLLQNPF